MGQLQVALRDARSELMRVNQAVSGRVRLAPMDLEVLDLIGQRGPLSPSALAALVGVSPATMTGILDRLEQNGWVHRTRDDPDDRRRVTVQMPRGRGPAIATHYQGMQARLQDACADYSDDQLELITDFLRRVAESGRGATRELRTEPNA
jgi:DNA-binding MarR family transcriptional regulator